MKEYVNFFIFRFVSGDFSRSVSQKSIRKPPIQTISFKSYIYFLKIHWFMNTCISLKKKNKKNACNKNKNNLDF